MDDLTLYKPQSLRQSKPETPHEVRWGIGILDDDGNYAMLAGPVPDEKEMLEIVGCPDWDIVRFDADASVTCWTWSVEHESWRRVVTKDRADKHVSSNASPEFSQDQARAWKKILAWLDDPKQQTFVLRGYAGTGKTFMMRQLQAHCGHRVVFTAPTNKAAKVLSSAVGAVARTTYSALGLKMEQQDDQLVLVASERLPQLPRDTILVIDEASMVGRELRRRVEEICASMGIRVIYVGDPLQLNPVGERRSGVWKLDLPITSMASLKKVMRFDNQLLQLATQIRGTLRSSDWDALHIKDNNDGQEGVWTHSSKKSWRSHWLSQVKEPRDSVKVKALAWRNKTVKELNDHMRDHLGFSDPYCVGEIMLLAQPIEREGSIIAHTDDEFEITSVEERAIEADGRSIRVHTLRAVQTEGDWGLDLNIPINRVLVDDVLGRLARKAQGQKGVDRKRAWTRFWDVHRLFTDVRFGYAMTVHRAQGSTYRSVYVDQGDILANRDSREAHKCLYVSVTRPTTQLHIV